MRIMIAALTGGLFGAGLLLSGMTDTRRVQGFLDILGAWDPTLAFVLGGAIAPMAIAWRIAARQSRALLGDLPEPAAPTLDRALLGGSLLFGAGWGLAGLCPGPAVASLSFGGSGGLIFMAAMLAAMAITPTLRSRLARP